MLASKQILITGSPYYLPLQSVLGLLLNISLILQCALGISTAAPWNETLKYQGTIGFNWFRNNSTSRFTQR